MALLRRRLRIPAVHAWPARRARARHQLAGQEVGVNVEQMFRASVFAQQRQRVLRERPGFKSWDLKVGKPDEPLPGALRSYRRWEDIYRLVSLGSVDLDVFRVTI